MRARIQYAPWFVKSLNDPLDYAGRQGEIAYIGTREKGVSIWVNGETRFYVPEKYQSKAKASREALQECFKNIPARKIGLAKSKVVWEANNWLELFPVVNGEMLTDSSEIAHDLREAVRMAEEMLGVNGRTKRRTIQLVTEQKRNTGFAHTFNSPKDASDFLKGFLEDPDTPYAITIRETL